MSTETRPARPATTPEVPEIHHWFCCDPDVAWCGEDVSTHRIVSNDTPLTCPLCAVTTRCHLCGRPLT